MTKLRNLDQTDKMLLAAAFFNAGIKARIRIGRTTTRVVFEADMAEVADLLNAEGFTTVSGRAVDLYAFNAANEIFIRARAA